MAWPGGGIGAITPQFRKAVNARDTLTFIINEDLEVANGAIIILRDLTGSQGPGKNCLSGRCLFLDIPPLKLC